MWEVTKDGRQFLATDGSVSVAFDRLNDAETYARLRNKGMPHDRVMLTVTNYHRRTTGNRRRRGDRHAALRNPQARR